MPPRGKRGGGRGRPTTKNSAREDGNPSRSLRSRTTELSRKRPAATQRGQRAGLAPQRKRQRADDAPTQSPDVQIDEVVGKANKALRAARRDLYDMPSSEDDAFVPSEEVEGMEEEEAAEEATEEQVGAVPTQARLEQQHDNRRSSRHMRSIAEEDEEDSSEQDEDELELAAANDGVDRRDHALPKQARIVGQQKDGSSKSNTGSTSSQRTQRSGRTGKQGSKPVWEAEAAAHQLQTEANKHHEQEARRQAAEERRRSLEASRRLEKIKQRAEEAMQRKRQREELALQRKRRHEEWMRKEVLRQQEELAQTERRFKAFCASVAALRTGPDPLQEHRSQLMGMHTAPDVHLEANPFADEEYPFRDEESDMILTELRYTSEPDLRQVARKLDRPYEEVFWHAEDLKEAAREVIEEAHLGAMPDWAMAARTGPSIDSGDEGVE